MKSVDVENIVFAIVRNPRACPDLLALAANNRNVRIIRADLHNVSEIQFAVDLISDATGGSLDVFIHNDYWEDDTTAVTPRTLEENVDEVRAALEKSVELNVWFLMRLLDLFLPLIRQSSLKKFIVVSSAWADIEFIRTTGLSRSIVYAISKAAVNIVVAKYANEYKEEGISFLALSPGWVDNKRGTSKPKRDMTPPNRWSTDSYV